MNRWLPFEWIAAVRFLRDGRLQTIFIIGGIAIGVGVIVFMSALLAGLQSNFIKRVLTSQPHIQLLAPDQIARPLRAGAGVFEDATVQRPSQRVISIDQWPKIRSQMLAMPEVVAVAPTIQGSALALRGDASRAITMSGVTVLLVSVILPLSLLMPPPLPPLPAVLFPLTVLSLSVTLALSL